METKEMTIEERIARLPENFRGFAKRNASEAVINALEMAARIDGKPDIETKEVAELSRSMKVLRMTGYEMAFFIDEFNGDKQFQTNGTREVRSSILDAVLLIERMME